MASVPFGNANCSFLLEKGVISYAGMSSLPFFVSGARPCAGFRRGTVISQCLYGKKNFALPEKSFSSKFSKKQRFSIPRSSSSSSNPNGSENDLSDQTKKTPFGYTRKDILLIGVGLTVIGVGLKSGLEFAGVDPLQAGNVVQLVMVLGLTIGWISTYIFRVSNKEMTYAQQLRDYENKVMEKRLEGLTEAELEALLEQVEEEKRSISSGEQVN